MYIWTKLLPFWSNNWKQCSDESQIEQIWWLCRKTPYTCLYSLRLKSMGTIFHNLLSSPNNNFSNIMSVVSSPLNVFFMNICSLFDDFYGKLMYSARYSYIHSSRMPITSRKKNCLQSSFPKAKGTNIQATDSEFSRGLCRLVAAVTMVNGHENPEPVCVAVPCFCDDSGQPCKGEIIVSLEDERGIIDWYCESCDSQGEIDSWQHGFFDCSDFRRVHVH